MSGMLSGASCAYALPSQGPFDNSASAIINNVGDKGMTVTGIHTNSVINWATFDVASDEIVKFTGNKNYLNLVHGVDMSKIYGTISGGNIVYLVNPNGILFAENSTLDNIGNFIASTRNISAINKEEFLVKPDNLAGVLGVDNPVMDNQNYHPVEEGYIPKIMLGNVKLTNVPESAKIYLDGPGGVILKSKDVMEKVGLVITRKKDGEVGIGSETGLVNLSEADTKKIMLVDGNEYSAYNGETNLIKEYKWVNVIGKNNDYKGTDQRIMLVSDDGYICTATVCHPKEGKYYIAYPNATGKVLTGNGYNYRLTINSKTNNANQIFQLVKCDDMHDYYYVINTADESLGLNNHNDIAANYNPVTLWPYRNAPHFKWTFYKTNDGSYFLRSGVDVNSGTYALDVDLHDTAEGSPAWEHSLNGTPTQQWQLISTERKDPTGPKVIDYSRYHGAITPVPEPVKPEPIKAEVNGQNYYEMIRQQIENSTNGITDKELDDKIAYYQRYCATQVEADEAADEVKKFLRNRKSDNQRNILGSAEKINPASEEGFDSVKNDFEKKKKEFLNKVLDKLLYNKPSTKPDLNDELWEEMEKNIKVDGKDLKSIYKNKKNKVPDDVWRKLMNPFIEKIKETAIKDISISNDNEKAVYDITNMVFNNVAKGLEDVKDQTIDNKYHVTYDMVEVSNGNGNLVATLKWKDESGNKHSSTVTYSSINSEYGKNNRQGFSNALGSIGETMTKNAGKQLIYSGLKDVVTKDQFDKGTKFVEKIVKALTNEDKAKELIEDCCEKGISKAEESAISRVEEIIKTIPGGENMLNAIEEYNDIANAYEKYKTEYNRWIFKNENGINSAYAEYESALNSYNTILKQLEAH